jgi:hypothetical protein
VFPAIKAPADQRTALVDRAARSPKINATAIAFGGKKKNRISATRICKGDVPVRFNVIALLRMKNEPLTALAAFDAPIAGHIRLLVWAQTLL